MSAVPNGRFKRLTLVLLLAAALLTGVARPAPPVAAQIAIAWCGSLGTGSESCLLAPSAGASASPSGPGTVTLTVTSPASVAVTTASGADVAGNKCSVSAGAGTATIALICPTGLQPSGDGPQNGGTLAVTFAATEPDILASVTYNAGQPGAATQSVDFRYPPIPPTGYSSAVSYAAGWNLVSGPPGWNLFEGPSRSTFPGPFFTYQAADSVYEIIPGGQYPKGISLPAGVGVWVYLTAPTTVNLSQGGGSDMLIPLPPSHWVMIGNPGYKPAMVSGADVAYIYDPATGSYRQTTLQPGQGAWAYSAAGGVAAVITR